MVIKVENGILVPVGDTQVMYEAMRSVLKDLHWQLNFHKKPLRCVTNFHYAKIAKTLVRCFMSCKGGEPLKLNITAIR